jgi:hypothetical protein
MRKMLLKDRTTINSLWFNLLTGRKSVFHTNLVERKSFISCGFQARGTLPFFALQGALECGL